MHVYWTYLHVLLFFVMDVLRLVSMAPYCYKGGTTLILSRCLGT